jgi:nicotinamide mononucleotide transporter
LTNESQESARTAGSDTAVLAVLTICVMGLGGAAVYLGQASILEAVSFVAGAICVWLVVKENIWNFPIGIINTAGYAVIFFEARLYGDASLNVLYCALGIMGWCMWLFGGDKNEPLRVVRAKPLEMGLVLLLVVIGTAILWRTVHLAGGSSPFWDALTTSLSLGAQWLLNRKRVENWILWIVADAIYVPLYIYRGLNLTALLYGVFFVMAVMGLRRWRAVCAGGRP